MKKTTKQIIGLSLAALFCGATAAVLPHVKQEAKAATSTNVFEIAEGASIRTKDPVGIRFIVKMSEDVKNNLVGKNFGFVISREDQFDAFETANQTPDYVNMEYKTTTEVAITAENLSTYIYEGEEEYAGYWCANIVINMNTENGDTEEPFTERTYSAVAYYENADETGRVYTTGRQERSIQDVASMLYLSNDSDWTNVKGTYEYIGTETTPILVAQSGKNSYDAFVANLANDINFGKDYKFELETDVTVDSKILDVESVNDITTVSGTESLQANVSFDGTKTYDSQSNGSYKLETSATSAEAKNTWSLNINPAFDKANYKAMQLVGYEYIAVRFMIEKYQYEGTVQVNYINGTNNNDEMYVYCGNKKVIEKPSSYVFWQNNLESIPTGEWAEMVLDIEKFVNNVKDGMTLLQVQVGAGASLDMAMYIDNVYAVKEFIGETKETVYQNKGTDFAVSEDMVCTATLDGQEIAVADNKVSLESCGVYSIKQTTRDTYGYVAQNVIPNGTVVSYVADNFGAKHIINSTSATTNYTGAKADDKIVVSSDGAGKVTGVSMTTYFVKTVGDKAYYEALQVAGYNYISYEFTLSFTGQSDTYDWYIYGFVNAYNKHRNEMTNASFPYQYSLNAGNITNSKNTTATYGHYINTSYPNANYNGKPFILSIPIQTVIDNYDSTMRILAFYFNAAATEMDYSVTFGRIEATTNACVFDD